MYASKKCFNCVFFRMITPTDGLCSNPDSIHNLDSIVMNYCHYYIPIDPKKKIT